MLTKINKAFQSVVLFGILFLFFGSNISIAKDLLLKDEVIIKNLLGNQLEGYILDTDSSKHGDLDGDGKADIVAIPEKGMNYFIL